jgi:hypothetical protein
MAHECVFCGSDCYCCGDIDDIVCTQTPKSCRGCQGDFCESREDDFDDEDEDEYDWDDDFWDLPTEEPNDEVSDTTAADSSNDPDKQSPQ